MNDPHFVGGALVIPPAKPAWREAKVSDLATLKAQNTAEAEATYAAVKNTFPHLDPEKWESMMALILTAST